MTEKFIVNIPEMLKADFTISEVGRTRVFTRRYPKEVVDVLGGKLSDRIFTSCAEKIPEEVVSTIEGIMLQDVNPRNLPEGYKYPDTFLSYVFCDFDSFWINFIPARMAKSRENALRDRSIENSRKESCISITELFKDICKRVSVLDLINLTSTIVRPHDPTVTESTKEEFEKAVLLLIKCASKNELTLTNEYFKAPGSRNFTLSSHKETCDVFNYHFRDFGRSLRTLPLIEDIRGGVLYGDKKSETSDQYPVTSGYSIQGYMAEIMKYHAQFISEISSATGLLIHGFTQDDLYQVCTNVNREDRFEFDFLYFAGNRLILVEVYRHELSNEIELVKGEESGNEAIKGVADGMKKKIREQITTKHAPKLLNAIYNLCYSIQNPGVNANIGVFLNSVSFLLFVSTESELTDEDKENIYKRLRECVRDCVKDTKINFSIDSCVVSDSELRDRENVGETKIQKCNTKDATTFKDVSASEYFKYQLNESSDPSCSTWTWIAAIFAISKLSQVPLQLLEEHSATGEIAS